MRFLRQRFTEREKLCLQIVVFEQFLTRKEKLELRQIQS
nr:MAG TPA: hypothetical protein [Caudoviricetes sp.]DAU61545.1 MAG TPA: hypothetical protein [Caudoviricetes sp.]